VEFVFVSDSPEQVRGGIERHAAALAAELRGRGHGVRLVPPAELTRRDVDGADWVVFDGVRRLAMLRHARRGSVRPRFAVIPHGAFLEEAHVGTLRQGGVWTPTARFHLRRAFDRSVGRRVFARFDRWIALNESEAADLVRLCGVPADRIDPIGPFVSPEFLAAAAGPPGPAPAGGPYVCSVARIERRKNFGALIEAVSDLPYRFLLAGQDRGGLAELVATARNFPAAQWEYLGTIPEGRKVDLLRGAEAVVIPSVAEGVPALALEARALGRPVVLAGVSYGPEGPGVVRCGARASAIRAALESLPRRPPVPPDSPLTVERAADQFLAALGR